MKNYFFIVFLVAFIQGYGQDKFTVLSIDSTEFSYRISIQKAKSSKSTVVYTIKDEFNKNYSNKIRVGEVYRFTFVERYRIGSPELRYDENGREMFMVKRIKFKKNNVSLNYSVLELDGLSYRERSKED